VFRHPFDERDVVDVTGKAHDPDIVNAPGPEVTGSGA
jgi:hypothetical protein